MGQFGTLKLGGQFMILSGLLHFLSPMLTGFANNSLTMIALGGIYLLIGAGLTRGMRWLGYFAFAIMIFASVGAYTMVYVSPTPVWLTFTIIAVNLLAALNLFVAIWRAPIAKAAI